MSQVTRTGGKSEGRVSGRGTTKRELDLAVDGQIGW